MLNKPGEFEKVNLPMPDLKEGYCVIKVKSIGICGSEMSAYKGIFPMGAYPRRLGHEISGEIISIAENNKKNLKVGDKVVLEPYRYCGECYPCRQGKTNCCENLKVISVHNNGAHTEYFAHEIDLVHKVPDYVSFEYAALAEPLTISIHGVHRARVKKGEHVVVTGAGPIGLLAAIYVKFLGAIPIMVDPLNKRLNIANEMGVEHVINPISNDAVKEIEKITHGRMAEAVIEASGASVAIEDAINYVAYTGRISLVGYPNKPVPIPTFTVTKKEIDILGSRNSVEEFPLAIEIIANEKVDLKPLITNIIDFDDLPDYFAHIEENPNNYLKVIATLD